MVKNAALFCLFVALCALNAANGATQRARGQSTVDNRLRGGTVADCDWYRVDCHMSTLVSAAKAFGKSLVGCAKNPDECVAKLATGLFDCITGTAEESRREIIRVISST